MAEARPIDLSDLLAGRREGEVTVQLNGEDRVIKFAWNPNSITAERWEQVNNEADEHGVQGWYSRWLASVLVWWDITDAGPDGSRQMAPITPQVIGSRLLMQWTTAILRHIQEAERPNPTTGQGSSDGPDTEGQQPDVPTGTQPSEEPEPAAALPGSCSASAEESPTSGDGGATGAQTPS